MTSAASQIHVSPDDITVIAAVSSPAFIEQAFDLYVSGTLFAVSRADTADHPLLKGAQHRSLPAGPANGWVTRSLAPITSDSPGSNRILLWH